MREPLANEPEVLTIEDVCRILRVKRSWCYNDRTLLWFRAGRLKRIYKKDLVGHIEAQRLRSVMRQERTVAVFETVEAMD